MDLSNYLLHFPHDRIPGCDKTNRGKGRLSPIDVAFRDIHTTDRHVVQYVADEDFVFRATKAAVCDQGLKVTMQWLLLDVDNEGHTVPTAAQRARMQEKIDRLERVHPGIFVYWTRHGWRLVYRLHRPFEVACEKDIQNWRKSYALIAAHLHREFDIQIDTACSDFGRLVRLPHTVRRGEKRPELLKTYGDPSNIGLLCIEFSRADLEHAMARCRKVFRPYERVDLRPSTSGGNGLFYHLLAARGDIGRTHERGRSVRCRCPNESQHSTGRAGDGSTLAYFPANGEHLGAIHCKHAHCVDLAASDWLRFFGEDEIARAERAAGIERHRVSDDAEFERRVREFNASRRAARV